VSADCPFCAIAQGRAPASLVCETALSLAFIDLRQFHPGHVLVIPRRHIADVRGLDEETGSAVMAMLSRVARAVDGEFENQGLSLWHSIGPAAHQEVTHLHFHVHPRRVDDGLLRVYPRTPDCPDAATRERYAAGLRARLAQA
jgi:histidine triad (HIT) family protein